MKHSFYNKFSDFTLKKKYVLSTLIVFIVLLGLCLRAYEYDKYPYFSETADELFYSWQGYSLLHEGTPIAWSWLEVYENRTITYINDKPYPLVSPWLDHPSVYSLLTIITTAHHTHMEEINNKTMRLIPLFLYLITSLLLYKVTIRRFPRNTALLSLFLFATVPTIVFLNRISVAENLLAPLFLLVVLLMMKFEHENKIKYLIFASITAGFALLTKEVGLFAFLFIGLRLVQKNNFKKILTPIASFVFFTAIYLLYGYFYDINLLINAKLEMVSLYPLDIGSFFSMMLYSKIFVREYVDIFVLIAWVSFFTRKFDNISLMITTYAISLLLTSGSIPHGTYLIPFFPFYAILVAEFIINSKNSTSRTILIAMLPLAYTRFLPNYLSKEMILWILRLIIGVVITSLIFVRNRKLVQAIIFYTSICIYTIINICLILLQSTTYPSIFG